jgi:hypothetical protein
MADMTSTEGQGIGNALSTGIQTGLDDLPELVGQQLADAFFRTDADRWKAAGQQIADWYSEPFMSVPDRLDRMSNRALKKAEWALEHHKGRIRRRSTEVAAALKNPIVRAAVESGTAVDVAVADFLVQQQKARTALAKWDRIRRTLFWFNGGGGNSAPPAQLPRGASPTAVASSAYGMTQAQAGFGRIASRNAAQAHYTVNVNAPASDPASVGQAVVRAIKAYESREGARWRSG